MREIFHFISRPRYSAIPVLPATFFYYKRQFSTQESLKKKVCLSQELREELQRWIINLILSNAKSLVTVKSENQIRQ